MLLPTSEYSLSTFVVMGGLGLATRHFTTRNKGHGCPGQAGPSPGTRG